MCAIILQSIQPFIRVKCYWASLVAQWLRIRLPMQGARVRTLGLEDPTCCRATKARVPQLLSLPSRVCEPQLLKPTHLEPVLCNKRSHHNEKPTDHDKEKAHAQQRRPNAAKNK